MNHSPTLRRFKSLHNQLLCIGLLCLLLVSATSQAIGLSTFRIYLDNQQRTKNFVVFNQDQYTQHCTQQLRHYEVDAKGTLSALPFDAIPPNAANPWIRYSPKRFSIAPGKSQVVKFQVKRRANTEAQEYRAHLSLECNYDVEEVKKNNAVQYGLQPVLRHNIPIIVRTGALPASMQFGQITIEDNNVTVDLQRNGQRSIYGQLALVDRRSNKVIDEKKHITLYLETPKKTVKLSTKGVDKEDLLLRFTEENEVEDRIIVQQTIG